MGYTGIHDVCKFGLTKEITQTGVINIVFQRNLILYCDYIIGIYHIIT